ncbi:MAG: TolC family protein [Fimbriimonas sp.]|nr:TolC family protein [Fimbriimonas sp.]
MTKRIQCLSRTLAFGLISTFCLSAALAQDQSVLTLDEALSLAKDRNGTVRSAYLQVKSADAVVVQQLAAFYPTLNAQYQYNSDRNQIVTTGNETSFFQLEGAQTFLNSSWTLLDSGQRDYNLRSATRSRDSRRFNAKQVLRSTLFSVVQQYYDTLRAQELERVAQAEVSRAQTILDQTQTRIKARDAAQIEELQANADFQNARVTALTARNTSTNAAATLKGTIGLQSDEPLPKLQTEKSIAAPLPTETLKGLVSEGLEKRPDLIAQRKNIESEHYSKMFADLQAGPTMNLSANYTEQMTPIALANRTLTFTVTMPLFDGGALRASARQIGYSIKADRASLDQAERVVRADIEAAYVELKTNAERLQAAEIALEAAQKNYDAAVDSQKAGAYDLLQVLTAQVSLVTAESNQIQALYDYRISDVNLKLVTGRPIPGE